MFNFRSSIPVCRTLCPSLETFTESFSVDEYGDAVLRRVSDFEELPDPSSYDLDKLIKAGVPLQDTRTNVIASDVRDIIESLDEKLLTEDKSNE